MLKLRPKLLQEILPRELRKYSMMALPKQWRLSMFKRKS